jgi:hypothetical protein
MKIIKGLLFLMTAAALVYAGQSPKELSSAEIQARLVEGINLNNVLTVNAFTSMLGMSHVPGGIVEVPYCGNDVSYLLIPAGPTLRDGIDSIVAADPEYHWYIEKGVVNLVPSAGYSGSPGFGQ